MARTCLSKLLTPLWTLLLVMAAAAGFFGAVPPLAAAAPDAGALSAAPAAAGIVLPAAPPAEAASAPAGGITPAPSAHPLAASPDLETTENLLRRAREAEARYEAESRQRKIQLLQRDKDLQEAALALAQSELIRTRAQYLTLALVLTALLGVVAGGLRIQVRVSRRSLAESRAAKEHAERGLRESEERFRTAFDQSALGFALLSLEGRWLRVNRAMCKVVGYTHEEMLATTFQAITHPDDLDGDLELVGRVLRGEIPSYHLEKRYFHKDGHIVWIWLDVSVVRDDHGVPRYFISQVQDITERKHAAEALQAAKEEAERANNAKSEFLSRTSHELRTPLNAILGFGQLLEIEDLEPRQHQSVEYIMTAGRHLLGLINDVLDMAKIENGSMALAPEPVSVALAARETLDLLRPLADQVLVRLEPPRGEEDVCVAADPRRLRQILLNLLSNAIKFNRPGGQVEIAWRRSARGGPRQADERSGSPDAAHAAGDAADLGPDRVWIEVADTGLGMAAEDCERIFSPFTRLPVSEKVEGTGLGLPLARSLAQGMGGTISVRSEPGRGSVFVVELIAADAAAASARVEADVFTGPALAEAVLGGAPLPAGASPPSATASAAAVASTNAVERAPDPAAGERLVEGALLYIEDNLANLRLVERIFEERAPGLRVLPAMRGRVGLDVARSERPDVILLDLDLPDMTGAEVLRALRADPLTAAVPVIVISADATPGHVRQLRLLGAADYLTKPFVVDDLLRALDEVLPAGRPVAG